MAEDWIKMRTDLYRDPKVCVIADLLLSSDGELARYVSQNMQRDIAVTRNVTRNATVGALVTVWGVMRLRGRRKGSDLFCPFASLSVIDDIADLPGFGDAMASVGWAYQSDDGLVFPRFFEEYNADPAEKNPSPSAERQRRYRERQKTQADGEKPSESDVTGNVTRDVTLRHREEKRREEKSKEKAATVVALTVELPDWIDREAWDGFAAMRRRERHPLTDRAAKLIVRELTKFREEGLDPNAVLDQSTRNGWRDVFRPKGVPAKSATDDMPDFMRGAL